LKNTDGAFETAGRAAEALDPASVLGMRPVREIQTGDVHAELHQVSNRGFGIASGADGANDLGTAHARILRIRNR
jgi:hypothetical protein